MVVSHFLLILFVLFLILIYLQRFFFSLVVCKQFDGINVSDCQLQQPTVFIYKHNFSHSSPSFKEHERFIIHITVCYVIHFWDIWNHSTLWWPVSIRIIFAVLSNVCVDLQNGLFPSGFSTKISFIFLVCSTFCFLHFPSFSYTCYLP